MIEDPGEDVTEPYEPLDPETIEKAREHGIEFSDWTPTVWRGYTGTALLEKEFVASLPRWRRYIWWLRHVPSTWIEIQTRRRS